MKIGILTQPLSYNYGGLLQAYALQTVLERLGHEVVILNRPMPYVSDDYKDSISERLRLFFVNGIKRLLNKPLTIVYHELKPQQTEVVRRITNTFVIKHIHKSPDFNSTEELADYCTKNRLDTYVVGSDQCWRPRYSPCLPNYFLDFAKEWNVKRISYAASFGVDNWEFTDEQTQTCAPLAQIFDAVSVREESGIAVCREHLGVDAVHVLDPTMLLDKEDYNILINGFDPEVFDIAPEHSLPIVNRTVARTLFNYVLDPDETKKKFINRISKSTGLTAVYCMPKDYRAREVFERCPDECTYPPVELWLQSFRDSEMVIADSFHGTVFSIIYNKPFWVLGNPGRGMARFSSLLKMFGLEDRLVTPDVFDKIEIFAPIDWNKVNARREELKIMSLDYLKNSLN